ncbi:hypothetical protein SAMD00023353_0104180 [Rosellinia necatrix]|uniref:Uncharacterized protein n=1 Tax=Rosellinia necatrix TaxID=77044 RepID=A0A1S7UI64_ROSNE|nr:hypothetical protein SAMD00023353_0104180 [Rosellinia necatrix]
MESAISVNRRKSAVLVAPEPGVPASGRGALVSCAEGPGQRRSQETPVRRTRVAATIIPNTTVDISDPQYAVPIGAAVVTAIRSPRLGHRIAPSPSAPVSLTPVVVSFVAERAVRDAAPVDCTVTAPYLCSIAAGTALVHDAVLRAHGPDVVAAAGVAYVVSAVWGAWEVLTMAVSHLAQRFLEVLIRFLRARSSSNRIPPMDESSP